MATKSVITKIRRKKMAEAKPYNRNGCKDNTLHLVPAVSMEMVP